MADAASAVLPQWAFPTKCVANYNYIPSFTAAKDPKSAAEKNRYPLRPDREKDQPGPTTAGIDWLTLGKFFNLIELTLAVIFLGLLAASLSVDSWKHHSIWKLRVWKWCVLLFVILGGRLASKWMVNAAIFLLNWSVGLIANWRKEDGSVWTFTPRQKFAHIVFGLRTSFQVFVWFGSVLLAWGLLVGRTGDHRSSHARKVIDHVTRALAGFLVGAGIWWIKNFVMELVAYAFIVERSRKLIVDSIVDQEALKSLWDNSRPVDSTTPEGAGTSRRKVVRDMEEVRNIKVEKVRTWIPPKLVGTLTRTKLQVVVDAQTKDCFPEKEAREAADELFARIARSYDAKYVSTKDVLNSLKEEGDKNRIRVGLGLEEGDRRISKTHFIKWVRKIHLERLFLLLTFKARDNVVGELNKAVSVATLLIISVVWLLIMGLLSTKVMILIATQILALNFLFSNTAKTIFEAIIFVFVLRPFDAGDICSIDNDEIVVHDMNLLNTIFKNSNGQTVFYPNAVLMTKSIINHSGLPETSDSVEFTIAASTDSDTINKFKTTIEEYLNNRPEQWRSSSNKILVENVYEKDAINFKREIVEKNVGIYVDHAINFYDDEDRKKNRQELLDEVKYVIHDLKIELRGEVL